MTGPMRAAAVAILLLGVGVCVRTHVPACLPSQEVVVIRGAGPTATVHRVTPSASWNDLDDLGWHARGFELSKSAWNHVERTVGPLAEFLRD